MKTIVWKKIYKDTMIFGSIFGVLLFLLSKFTNCLYYIDITLLCMGLFLVVNASLYSVLHFSYYKKVFSNGEEKIFLKISNGYKIVSTIFTVFIMSYAISQIADGITFYSQKQYFKNKKDYSYVEICCGFYDNTEDEENMQEMDVTQEIEQTQDDITQNIEQTQENITQDMETQTNFATEQVVEPETTNITEEIVSPEITDDTENTIDITEESEEDLEDPSERYIKDLYVTFKELDRVELICDATTMYSTVEYMYINDISLIKELNITEEQVLDNSKIYICIHEDDDDKIEEAKMQAMGIDENREVVVNKYRRNIKKIGVSKSKNGYTSKYLKNPCIVYYPGNFDNVFGLGYYTDTCMYKISDFEWLEFLHKHNIENEICYKTNVYDNYLYILAEKKRNIFVGVMMSLILLLLEAIIIRNTIRTEYRVNAIKLSLKKILGENFFERNRSIFRLTFISSVIALLGSCILTYFMNKSLMIWTIVGGIIMIGIEVAYITYFALKMERRNIVKILKGGSL